jgi:competence protein ComGC
MTETTSGKKKPSLLSEIAPFLAYFFLIGVLALIVIPNYLQVVKQSNYSNTGENTCYAVTKSIEYAKDKGVYPTSLRALAEEGYFGGILGAIRDKDPWGNDYVLSPLLTEGRTPKAGDDVYVYSRGQKGTGVYPEPFIPYTGPDGAIGCSSVHGSFNPMN